uniref:Transposase n=1 Tax=Globodera pallida TaxID=36090 RepID=A0A183BVV5_GLOPA
MDHGSAPLSLDMPTRINRTVHVWTTSRGSHRAGMDAFMTGFAVLFFQLGHAYRNSGRLDCRLAGRIALPGKEFPLLIRKANFVTQTESHQLNWARVESRRRAFDRAKYARWTDDGREMRGTDSDAKLH